jgi:hypothetical protein
MYWRGIKSPTPDILYLRFVYLGEFKGCDWPHFLPVQRGAELARLIPRAKRAQSD